MAGQKTITFDASEVNQLVDNVLKNKAEAAILNDVGRIMVNDTRLNFRQQSDRPILAIRTVGTHRR